MGLSPGDRRAILRSFFFGANDPVSPYTGFGAEGAGLFVFTEWEILSGRIGTRKEAVRHGGAP